MPVQKRTGGRVAQVERARRRLRRECGCAAPIARTPPREDGPHEPLLAHVARAAQLLAAHHQDVALRDPAREARLEARAPEELPQPLAPQPRLGKQLEAVQPLAQRRRAPVLARSDLHAVLLQLLAVHHRAVPLAHRRAQRRVRARAARSAEHDAALGARAPHPHVARLDVPQKPTALRRAERRDAPAAVAVEAAQPCEPPAAHGLLLGDLHIAPVVRERRPALEARGAQLPPQQPLRDGAHAQPLRAVALKRAEAGGASAAPEVCGDDALDPLVACHAAPIVKAAESPPARALRQPRDHERRVRRAAPQPQHAPLPQPLQLQLPLGRGEVMVTEARLAAPQPEDTRLCAAREAPRGVGVRQAPRGLRERVRAPQPQLAGDAPRLHLRGALGELEAAARGGGPLAEARARLVGVQLRRGLEQRPLRLGKLGGARAPCAQRVREPHERKLLDLLAELVAAHEELEPVHPRVRKRDLRAVVLRRARQLGAARGTRRARRLNVLAPVGERLAQHVAVAHLDHPAGERLAERRAQPPVAEHLRGALEQREPARLSRRDPAARRERLRVRPPPLARIAADLEVAAPLPRRDLLREPDAGVRLRVRLEPRLQPRRLRSTRHARGAHLA